MRADAHPSDDERLKSLRSYGILDTPREADFDDIAGLAASICETPISLISFLDSDRNWFKAEVGTGLQEAPRDTAFCAHGILEDDFVEINDTLSDPRTCDNPLALGEPRYRFYAGAQLIGHDGLPLGMLCVFDKKPRHLTAQQRAAMLILARLVIKQLELRRSLRSQDILHREIDHRVKNSLQTVSSLVRLQAHSAASDEVRAALLTVNNRIESIAALHHALYRTDTGNSIRLDLYLDKIISLARESLPDNLQLSGNFDAVTVDSQAAAAIATIINEFATNSAKHGFADGRQGQLDFRGNLADDGQYHLVLSDNGDGLSAQSPPRVGLGHQIIEATVDQLKGVMLPETGDAKGHRLHAVLPLSV